ncbi:YciI family protein [Mariniflexile sp. HMF6888]|uniref:YciI family protein n=1 Tax=Mariniflexile sp. HMF6888 TaxID=3373086 RepID=UPI0037A86FDC
MKAQETFLYRLELLEKFKTKNQWKDKEHNIQKEHVAYLDSLTNEKKIIVAGITEQGLKNHEGLVILRVESYEEALTIVKNDPSVKHGMMTADIEKFNVYFWSTE